MDSDGRQSVDNPTLLPMNEVRQSMDKIKNKKSSHDIGYEEKSNSETNFQDIDIGDIENGNGDSQQYSVINRFTSHQSNSSTSLQAYYQDSDELQDSGNDDGNNDNYSKSDNDESSEEDDSDEDYYSDSGTEVSSSSSYASDSSYDGEDRGIALTQQLNDNKNEVRLNMEDTSEDDENSQYSAKLLQRQGSSLELSSSLNSSALRNNHHKHRKHLQKKNSKALSISGAGETARKLKETKVNKVKNVTKRTNMHNNEKKDRSRHQNHNLDLSMSGSKYSQLSQSRRSAGSKGKLNGGVHTLDFNVVNFSAPMKDGSKKQILHNIAGQTQSGQFTALMGPSGAGKTTLMDCIALRNRKWFGAIKLNGKSPKGDYFNSTAYVHQKELFFTQLTVKEHLRFHAVCRLAPKRSTEECYRRVDKIIKEVNLEKSADTIIGGGEFYVIKGLSGGERKRLAIGTELLAQPKILFLDEPTSGLDSVMGELITELLMNLAAGANGGKRRIIFCVIHTPSSKMWNTFSHVLLLSAGGKLAYHGKRTDLMPFLSSIDYNVPQNYNPADYALEVISKPIVEEPGTNKQQKSQRKDPQYIVKMFAKHRAKQNPNFYVIPEDNKHSKQYRVKADNKMWTHLYMNTWRAFLQVKRDKEKNIVMVLMLFILGVIFGFLFLNQAHDSWRNLIGLLYAMTVSTLLLSSMHVALAFPSEWTIFMREYYVGGNTLLPYYIGRTLADIPQLTCYLITPFMTYFLAGMGGSWTVFFYYMGISFLVILASSSVGYLNSSFSSNPALGLAITPVITTPMILFSGMLYERSKVPFYLSWMQYTSVINYSFGALTLNECIHMGDTPMTWLILTFVELKPQQFSNYVLMLFLMIFGYRFLSFIVLRFRVKHIASN